MTIARYREALNWVIRDIGDLSLSTLNVAHVLILRRKMDQRGCGEARVAAILNVLRSFLRFCREGLRVAALDPRQIRVPRIPRRDVLYLTKEEVDQFLGAIIRPGERWDEVPLARLRFRALVEVLLGTGARISEILALDRRDVDFERMAAKIVGKGKKQRLLFFTDRALEWLGRYLTVTKSEDRLASLLQAAAGVLALQGGLPLFWFTSEKRFTPERPASIFEPIWETPDRPGEGASLIPARQPDPAHACPRPCER